MATRVTKSRLVTPSTRTLTRSVSAITKSLMACSWLHLPSAEKFASVAWSATLHTDRHVLSLVPFDANASLCSRGSSTKDSGGRRSSKLPYHARGRLLQTVMTKFAVDRMRSRYLCRNHPNILERAQTMRPLSRKLRLFTTFKGYIGFSM